MKNRERNCNSLQSAFQICEEKSMLYAYIYCCRQYMTDEEYEEFLTDHEIFREANDYLNAREEEWKAQISVENPKEMFRTYKQVYKLN